MAITVKQVIYLGTFADADTDETTASIENGSVYQQTFGSAGAPINNNLEDLTLDDADNSGTIETDNNPTSDITDGLGGPAALDSLAVVNVTVTYADGSTATFGNVVMFQTSIGDLFLANSNFAGTDLRDPGGEPLQSITVNSITNTNYTGLFQNNLENFTCFVAGTRIKTPLGLRPVDDLTVGDLVDTLDHGAQPIRWIGASRVVGLGAGAPVEIAAGALGDGLPTSRLRVSAQHRMLIRSPVVARVTGQSEALIAAKALLPLPGITRPLSANTITYYHMLFDAHEIVMSQGAPTESFWPGPQALAMLGPVHTRAVQSILARKGPVGIGPMARQELKGRVRKKIVARHVKNAKPVFGPPRAGVAIEPLCS